MFSQIIKVRKACITLCTGKEGAIQQAYKSRCSDAKINNCGHTAMLDLKYHLINILNCCDCDKFELHKERNQKLNQRTSNQKSN